MKTNASKTKSVRKNRNPKPARPSEVAFCNRADVFLQAATALHDVLRQPGNMKDISVPLAFLYFRSLELSCKACLQKDKYTDAKVMKDLGHRLSALLDELEKNRTLEHLQMKRQDFQLVDDFSEDYSDKWIEYSPGYTELPDLDSLSGLVEKFVRATQGYLKSNIKTREHEKRQAIA